VTDPGAGPVPEPGIPRGRDLPGDLLADAVPAAGPYTAFGG
jgi:hypothetical protein